MQFDSSNRTEQVQDKNSYPTILGIKMMTMFCIACHVAFSINRLSFGIGDFPYIQINFAAFTNKSKDWLARNQDNVSEYDYMSTQCMLFQRGTIKIQLSCSSTK